MSEQKGIIARITDAAIGAGDALKGVFSSARELHQLTVDYSVKEKTQEILNKLSDVQMRHISQQELLIEAKERIIQLENEKKEKENWEAEASRYELFSAMPGTLVYRIKPSENDNEPVIYLCPQCYNRKQKSILQVRGISVPARVGMVVDMQCHSCNSSYMFARKHFPKTEELERQSSFRVQTDYDPYD